MGSVHPIVYWMWIQIHVKGIIEEICGEKGYNYGLTNLTWDVKVGTVTGKTRRHVGCVVLKDGETKLEKVKVSNQLFIMKVGALTKGDKKRQ